MSELPTIAELTDMSETIGDAVRDLTDALAEIGRVADDNDIDEPAEIERACTAIGDIIHEATKLEAWRQWQEQGRPT